MPAQGVERMTVASAPADMPEGAGPTAGAGPGSPPWRLVPDWLTNLAAVGWRVVVVGVLAVAVLAMCAALWTTTASILVAAVVSAVFAPAVIRLRDRGRSRNAAAGIVWAAALGIIGALVLLLAWFLVPQAVDLVHAVQAGIDQAKDALAALGLPPAVVGTLKAGLEMVTGALESATGGLVSAAAEAVTIAIIATFLLFFFLRDGDRAWVWVFQNVSDHKRDAITAAGDDALRRVGGYLRGTTILAAIMAGSAFAFMVLLGVPLVVPLTLLVFLGTYIPYFGGIIASGAILLVAYAALGAWSAIALLVLFGVRNAVVGYGIRPQLYGRTVRLHPALVLIALPAGYEVGGVVGLFAAVPVIAVVLTVWSSVVLLLEPDEPPALPALVPPALDRAAQVSWRLLVALGVVALAAGACLLLPLVVLPVVGALVLAATLASLVVALQRRGQSRARAAALSVAGTCLVVLAVLLVAVAALVDQAPELGAQVTAGARSASASLGGQLDLPADAAAQGIGQLVHTMLTVGSTLLNVAIVALLSGILAFYLLADGPAVWSRLLVRVPVARRADVDLAGTRAVSVLGGYMVGTAAISFVGAASQWLIMVILGLPLALPVFVLSFLLCFIPYVGGFISTGIAFLIALAVGSPVAVIVMLIWTVVFNIVQGNVVSPLVYGRTVHLHPAIVLVAIPAAASVAGMLGMFVVVPALGVVAATWRTVLAILDGRASGEGGPIVPRAGDARRSPDRPPPVSRSPRSSPTPGTG